MLQDRKKKKKKKHNRKRTATKRVTMYYCPPPPLRGDKTLSCLPGAPASMLREKNKHKQTKTSTTGSAPQEKQTTVHPSPSQRRDKLENLKLCVVVRPRTRTRNLLTPPLRFLWALRCSRPSTLSWCRFALASLGDARPADALRFVVVKHAAAIAVEPPATSSLPDVAMRGLRRSVLLMAQFTVRTRHGAPLRCAELFGSSAARVPSFLCCVCPLLVCPCVSNLHFCGAPRCLTCNIAGSASIVQVLHYRGRCLCSDILPALYRAPGLFNLHYRGPSTVLRSRALLYYSG